MFCAFIELKRAFDSVWRSGLWYKLNMFKINGKCFQLIRNIYENIKSCIILNGVKSDFFDCNIGVRQGENLSPFLFCVFLNDLESFGNVEILEQVQLHFLKFVLNLKRTTPNYIVYGETGILPLRIEKNYCIISYWTKLVTVDNNKLCSQLYFIAKSYFDNARWLNNFSWIELVRHILTLNGFSGIWDVHQFPNRIWLAKAVKQKLIDISLNEWKAEVETRPSSYIYRIFKTDFEFEHYLTHVPFSLRKIFIKISHAKP